MAKIIDKQLGLTKLLQKQNGAILGDTVYKYHTRNK